MIDPKGNPADQLAVALLRAHLLGRQEDWTALHQTDDLPALANALLRVASVLAQLILPAGTDTTSPAGAGAVNALLDHAADVLAWDSQRWDSGDAA